MQIKKQVADAQNRLNARVKVQVSYEVVMGAQDLNFEIGAVGVSGSVASPLVRRH